MTDFALVDYHKGNLLSVRRALEQAGARVEVTDDPQRVRAARAVVLPGVGAFADAMETLDELGLSEAIRERALAGAPFLGICLGMHLMFEEGVEGAPGADGGPGGAVAGLGLLPGTVGRLPRTDEAGVYFNIPHVGWNTVEPAGEGGTDGAFPSPLLEGVATGEYFYFTHSFAAPEGPFVTARTRHSVAFPSAVQYAERAFGVQFHPEKSSDAGLHLLRNFVRIAQEG